MLNYDVVVIGSGAAGLLSAISAKENAAKSVLVIEREEQLGGFINKCINIGYAYKEQKNLTGPEYIETLIDEMKKLGIDYMVNSLVINLSLEKLITIVSEKGLIEVQAKAVILASGCRERPKGTTNILGSKAAGIFTAGTVQTLVNVEGYMPGKQIVIAGCSNMSLAIAKRLTLEGANVKAVVESAYPIVSSSKKIKECLIDFNIPLKLSSTIVDIIGKERVEGVTIAKVDENKTVLLDTEEFIECNTLILSVSILPECELLEKIGGSISKSTNGAAVDESMQTNLQGIYACGSVINPDNELEILIDQSYTAGKNAAGYHNR